MGSIKNLVLVDGYHSPERTALARSWQHALQGIYLKGNLTTTPEKYVEYMAPALDGKANVVIECSWHQQVCNKGFVEPEWQAVIEIRRARYRMLDRLALACNAVLIHHTTPAFPQEELNVQWVLYKPVLALRRNMEPTPMHNPNEGPGIGRWANGVVLVVGDQHGATKQPYDVERNIAFCSMSRIGCSEWLSRQMDLYGVRESHLYWINARDAKDRWTADGFVDALRPSYVVALGDEAARWCVRAKVKYTKVAHPQYWKRFHSQEEYALLPLLRLMTRGVPPDALAPQKSVRY